MANVERVRGALRRIYKNERVRLLVSSAACGADLIGLDEAQQGGIRCRIVLPTEPSQFRRESVVDRGEVWGTLFDRILEGLVSEKDLIVLPSTDDAIVNYKATNKAIVDEASSAAAGTELIALVVWDGRRRKENDFTEHFRLLARMARAREICVSTL